MCVSMFKPMCLRCGSILDPFWAPFGRQNRPKWSPRPPLGAQGTQNTPNIPKIYPKSTISEHLGSQNTAPRTPKTSPGHHVLHLFLMIFAFGGRSLFQLISNPCRQPGCICLQLGWRDPRSGYNYNKKNRKASKYIEQLYIIRNSKKTTHRK